MAQSWILPANNPILYLLIITTEDLGFPHWRQSLTPLRDLPVFGCAETANIPPGVPKPCRNRSELDITLEYSRPPNLRLMTIYGNLAAENHLLVGEITFFVPFPDFRLLNCDFQLLKSLKLYLC